MSWFRVYEIDILRVGQLYLQQGIDSLYPAAGTVLASDGSGGTTWTTIGGSQAALTSTILGLGSLGYVSTAQLQSTVNGLGNIYLSTGGGGTGNITTANLTSSLIGLGTLGYISSLSSFNSKTATISSLTTSNLTASTAYISSLSVDSLIFGDGTGWIDFGVVRAQAVSTIQINSYIANLTQVNASSLKGDGSQIYNLNAISAPTLYSTVQGLGQIYLSSGGGTGNVTTANLTSSLIGLGTMGYISSGTGGVTTAQLTSTTIGLGTLGYLSSGSLSSFSTAIGTVFYSQSTGVSSLNAPYLTGLQGSLSSLQVNSLQIGTGTGWVNIGPIQTVALSTIVLNSQQVVVSSIQGDGSLLQKIAGLSTVSAYTSNTSNYFTNVLQNFSTPLSTVANFTSNTSNYYSNLLQNWSTPLSTVSGFTSNTSNYARGILQDWSTGQSTLGLFTSNTSNFYKNNLQDWSTQQTTIYQFTSNTSNYYANTVQNWSTALSTVALFTSNVQANAGGAGVSSLFGIVSSGFSTIALFTSNTSNFYSNLLQNWSTPLLSTTAGFTTSFRSLSVQISTLTTSNLTTSNALISSLIVNSLQFGDGTGWVEFGPLRTVAVSTIQINVDTIYANQVSSSTFVGDGSQLTNLPAISSASLQSTVRGLGQLYLSSISQATLFTSNTSNFYRNVLQNYSTMFSTGFSTIALFTSNTSNFYGNLLQDFSTPVSTVALFTSNTSNFFLTNAGGAGTSSIFGLVSSGFSTLALFTSNTSNYFQNTFQNWSTPLLSTTTGLGNIYLSSALTTSALTSTTAGLGQIYISTQSLRSTTAGLYDNLGQVYISSIGKLAMNYSQRLGNSVTVTTGTTTPAPVISTTITTQGFPVQVIVTGDAVNSNAGSWARLQLYRGTTAIGNVVWVESSAANENVPFAINFIDAQVSGTYEYFMKVVALAGGDWGFGETDGPVLTAVELNTGNGISPGQLASTVNGLGQFYVSTAASGVIASQLFSTTAGLGRIYISTISEATTFTSNTSNYYLNLLQNWSSAVSTVALYTSNTSNYFLTNAGGPGTSSLFGVVSTGLSTVARFTSNTSNYYFNLLQNYSTMFSTGLSTVGLFTSNTSNYYSNLLQNYSTMFSTGLSTVALFTSNTSNYFQNTLQNFSTPVSTVALFTSNTSNYFQNTLQNWSTPLISTVIGLGNIYLSTAGTGNVTTVQLTSTAIGLGTFGYISSSQLASTVTGFTTSFRSLSSQISTLTTSNLTGQTGFISSLQVDSLQFGDGTGWADFGAIRAVVISTIQVNVDTIYANQVSSSTFIGDGSQLRNLPAISSATLLSTVRGLGQIYISSISQATQFTSNTSNYYSNLLQNYSTMFSTGLSTVALFTSNTSNYFQNTIQNYSTGLSTTALFTSNTSNYFQNTLQNYSTMFSTGLSTVALFTSNTSNYARGILQDWSTQQNTIYQFTSNTSNYYSNLLQNYSTGLSTTALFTSNTSNYYKNLLQDFSTGLSTIALFTSNTSNFFVTNAGGVGTSSLFGVISTGLSTIALFTSNTSNYYSNLLQNYSTPVSTVALFTSNTSNYYFNLLQNFSTPVSTVALFTSNTSNYFQNTLQNWSTPLSTVSLFTSNTSNFAKNILQDFSTGLSTVALFTSNTSNFFVTNAGGVGTSSLFGVISTGLSTTALFTSNTSNYYSNLLQNFSTPVSTVALFTSNTSNYYSNLLQNFSTPVSTVALFTSNTSNYYSNLLQNFSTPLSTVARFTSNTSNYYSNLLLFNASTSMSSFSTAIGTIFYSQSTGVSSLNANYITSLQASISSLQVNALQIGTGTGWINIGPIQTVALSSIVLNSQQAVVSSIQGDGSLLQNVAGLSTVALLTSNTSNWSRNLLQNYSTMFSTAISTATLFTSNTSNYYANLLQNYSTMFSTAVSTATLFTSNTSNYFQNTLQNWSSPLSTVALFTSNSITSTTLGLANIYVSTNALESTVRGLGTAGYISSLTTSSLRLSTGTLTTSTIAFIDVNTAAQQILLVSSGVLTLNGQGIGGGGGSGSGMTVSDYVVGGVLTSDQTITPGDPNKVVQFSDDFDPQNWYNPVNYRFTPTIAGYYYVSYAAWFRAIPSGGTIQQQNIQIEKNGTTTMAIAQMVGNATDGTSLELTKIIYLNGSTDYLRFTAYNGSSSNVLLRTDVPGTFFSAALLTNGSSGDNLISTVRGLGSIGYISTISTATAFTSNTSNYYSNLLQNWSTPDSTIALFTSNTSNWSRNLLQNYSTMFSTGLSTVALFTSNTSNYYSNLLQNYSTMFSTGLSTVALFTSNTSNFYSNLQQNWSTSIYSSLIGLGTFGYISTGQFLSSQVGMYSNISSMVDITELTSTVIGLGSAGFASSIGLTAILNSTVTGLTSNISSMIDPTELASTVVGIAAAGYISSTQLDKYLASTTSGLGTAGYASTSYVTQTSNYFANLLQNWSTGLSTIALFTSNTSNFYSNLQQNWSTPLYSTATGLGTYGYISSSQLTSTVTGFVTSFRSLSVAISTLTTSNLTGQTGYISSLQVDSLQFGDGTGWADFGAVRAVVISTIQLNVDTVYANQISSSTFIGDGSQLRNLPAISSATLLSTVRGLGQIYLSTLSQATQFTSNTSNYFQNTLQNYSTMFSTAVSTVALFTSNTSNYFQNTLQNYSTMFSTGLSTVALFTSNTSNYFQNTLQNYSTMFSTGLSTVALFTSNTSNYAKNILQDWSTGLSTVALFTSNAILSTTIGLGTAGYISSLQLQSTTIGLQQYVSTFAAYPANTTGEVLYLNESISTTNSYKALQILPVTDGLLYSTFSTITRNTNNFSINQFKTDFGLPPFIPPGIWDLNLYAKSVYSFSYLWTSLHQLNGIDETVIATSSNNPVQVTPTNIITNLTLTLVVPYTNISTGNSLILRLYANNSNNQDDQLTTYFQDSEYSHVHTTFGTIIPSQYLTSTVDGLGTLGYISTAQYVTLSNFYSPLLSNNYSTNLSTISLFTSNTSNYFAGLQGSTLSLSTGNVTTSSLFLRDPYAESIAIFQSSSLLFYGNVVLAGYGQLQPQLFTF